MRRRIAGVAGVVGLVIAVGLTGSALAAKKPKKRAFSETVLGSQISGSGNSFEAAYKVTDSLNGNGAAVQVITANGTTFPVTGTSTTTVYFANGSLRITGPFTIAPPDASGVSVLSGSGKCTGGTGIHKKEKCTLTVTGTYNTKTTVATAKITGTDTR